MGYLETIQMVMPKLQGFRFNLCPGLEFAPERRDYPDPESWVPDRWMVNPSTKMDATEQDKWFWAFGSGSRRCLGQNLAMEGKETSILS
jgi:hypothetical protein